jgi:Zn-dependent protease with chaperone function
MTLLVSLWALWALANLALLLGSPHLVKHASGPFTNGFKIVVPEGLSDRVTPEEMDAMLCHERGHIAHRHSIQNLFLSCLLIPRSRKRFEAQELEADDYAASRGHGPALASSLRKLSSNDFDWFRAARLTKAASQPH